VKIFDGLHENFNIDEITDPVDEYRIQNPSFDLCNVV